MRLRVGLVLCLFLAFLGAGCRKALGPNVDDNQAPETWITAAPQDTITTRTPLGVPIDPSIGRIPVRYHMYWAGADRDGEVVGYYWAVVETLATAPGDGLPIPNLPGPKAHDYHFTTKSDSIFIFTASEDVSERQHAFYVYAVDNKGKPDPTPARFIFRAYDRFPPLAIIDEAKAVGRIYKLNGAGGVTPELRTYSITDSFEIGRPFPRDTVPSNAVLTFKWHGEPTIPSTVVLGYRWKLDEPNFNVGDSTVHMATYNTGVGSDRVSAGVKRFTLRAIGQSGWRGQSTRYFQKNFAPDDWFSGPDVNDAAQGWQSYPDNVGKLHYYQSVGSWASFAGIPNTLLSSDSVQVLPASRPERRTFFEIYGDTVFAHSEGDTVNLNSWVVIPSGGFDQDSPYKVNVGIDPNRPIGPVTTKLDSANGSPVGFRSLVITKRSTDNSPVKPTESSTYPVFDVGSVFYAPHISTYNSMSTSGKCYAYTIAEDGDGAVDRRLQREGGSLVVADAVDFGSPSLEQQQVRSKVLTFYVNRAPYFLTSDPTFKPRPNTTTPRVVSWLVLANDSDPIDWSKPVSSTGGPQDNTAPVLVRTVTVYGKNAAGRDTSFVGAANVEFANISFSIPTYIVPGAIRAELRLDDYRPADADSHPGRTTIINVPLTLLGPEPADVPAGTGASSATQRPGSPQADGRRQ